MPYNITNYVLFNSNYIAADLSLTTAATFPRTIAQRPLPPDPSRERPTSDITLTQTGQTDTLWNNSHNGVKETGLLSTSR